VSDPLLNQFQNWIKQLEDLPESSFSEQLAQWQHWAVKLQQHSRDLAPDHADLVSQLTVQSNELIELLADLTRAQARGPNLSNQVERLRTNLHQFNLRRTLEQATPLHQFLNLLITQRHQLLHSNEQREQLQALLQQFNHPRLGSVKALLEALLNWQASISTFKSQLDQVSDAAIEDFLSQADGQLSHEELLALWVRSYDQAYAAAFNQADLPKAQADMISSLARLQNRWQQLIDQYAEQLGIPSRNQLDQLIEQLDQQRRRIRKLEQALEQINTSQGE